MLFNGKYKGIDKNELIEKEIYANTLKNVMNFDLYSKKEVRESLDHIQNLSSQFSLWLNDLEAKVQDALYTKNQEIILEGIDLQNQSYTGKSKLAFGRIFNNFEKLKIEEGEIEIDQEIKNYLKENKRAANKRRKNFSYEDEGNFIKKKAKENLNKVDQFNKEIKVNLEIKEIEETPINSKEKTSDENFTKQQIEENEKIEILKEIIDDETNQNQSTLINSTNSDNKQNAYFIIHAHNGLKEVIEEMPSKEEDNFRFSSSNIEKRDSNIEMKQKSEKGSANIISTLDLNKLIDNPQDSNEKVLNFNLNCLSEVKSNQEKCSNSVSTLNNFNINEILADFHDSNLVTSEDKHKDNKKVSILDLPSNENEIPIIQEVESDKLANQLPNEINNKESIVDPIIEKENFITDNICVENPVLKTHEKIADKKFVINSSNIKFNLNSISSKNNLINNKLLNTNQKYDHSANPKEDLPYNNQNNPSNFTFFKEKTNNKYIQQIQNNSPRDKNITTNLFENDGNREINKNNLVTSSQPQMNEIGNIQNNNNQIAPSTTKINSNFLKDKDNLFNILFNYNDSYSNLEESPAVEKWNPTNLESSTKNGLNLKNKNNHTNLQSESHNKVKILANKTFKENGAEVNSIVQGNNFKSNNPSKQKITINNNNAQNQNNLMKSVQHNSNNFSQSKNIKNYSQSYDSEKVCNIKNNITKTLTKKIIDPGYEITDQSGSSSDDKKDSDSDDKLFGTPVFKNLKIPKYIPKWANDKKYINERVLYQKNYVDYNTIFGICKVDNLNLNLIFTNTKKEYNQPRGDSADWKLDNTISSHTEEKNFEGGNSNNHYTFNNYNSYNANTNFSVTKNMGSTNRKLLEVFNNNK